MVTCIASAHPALPASYIDSSSNFYHYFPIMHSVLTNTLLDMIGTPSILMNSPSFIKLPPVAICPHIAARLQLQYLLPSGEVTFVDVQNEILWPQSQHW